MADLRTALDDLGDDAVACRRGDGDGRSGARHRRAHRLRAELRRRRPRHRHRRSAALQSVAGPFGVSYEVRTAPNGDVEVGHTSYLFAVDDTGTPRAVVAERHVGRRPGRRHPPAARGCGRHVIRMVRAAPTRWIVAAAARAVDRAGARRRGGRRPGRADGLRDDRGLGDPAVGGDRRRRHRRGLVPPAHGRARQRGDRRGLPAGAVPAVPTGRGRRGEPALADDVPQRQPVRRRRRAGRRRCDAAAGLAAGRFRWPLCVARPPGPPDEPGTPADRAPGDQVQAATVAMDVNGEPVDVAVAVYWLPAPSRVPLAVGAAIGRGWSSWRVVTRHRLAWPLLAVAVAAAGIGWWQFSSLPSETGPLLVWWLLPAIATVSVVVALALGRRLVSYALVLLAALELGAWVLLRRDGAFAGVDPDRRARSGSTAASWRRPWSWPSRRRSGRCSPCSGHPPAEPSGRPPHARGRRARPRRATALLLCARWRAGRMRSAWD